MPLLETEVKFYLADLASMHAGLLGLGARSLGRSFERNIRFDDAEQTLSRTRSLLRLRQDRKSTLTFKSTPEDADPAFKQLSEQEVGVEDFDAMHRILISLGFHPQQVYEKWRETLRLEDTVFCLDSLPFGDFLEIEGSKKNITRFASRLNLDWSMRILATYLEMFDLIRARDGLTFSDVTFSNFAAHPARVHPYLHLLVAGHASARPHP
jgi:adenylate cyclase, class 2